MDDQLRQSINARGVRIRVIERELAELQRELDELQDAQDADKLELTRTESRGPRSDWAGTSFAWSADVERVLRQRFGLRDFRTNQREDINATLSGFDVFCVMRAGGGTSLP